MQARPDRRGLEEFRAHSGTTLATRPSSPLTACTWRGSCRCPGGTLHILLGGWLGLLSFPWLAEVPHSGAITTATALPGLRSLEVRMRAPTDGCSADRQAHGPGAGQVPRWAPHHAASGTCAESQVSLPTAGFSYTIMWGCVPLSLAQHTEDAVAAQPRPHSPQAPGGECTGPVAPLPGTQLLQPPSLRQEMRHGQHRCHGSSDTKSDLLPSSPEPFSEPDLH